MIPSILPTYARAPFSFTKGEGTWLIEEDGRRFLDLGAGIAVNALGHAHPSLVAALTEQAQNLWHVSNLYTIPQQTELADQLVAQSFADTVFFTNSGTESCELAVKMARKYWFEKGQSDRVEIITFSGSFHGRSSAGIAAAGSEKMTKGFGHNLLLIFDEVQCGIGRSGKLFAHEWAGVAPDIMMVAKGIGGGFPLGAVLASEAAALGMGAGTHGSTYGGNPLACAVGCAVLTSVADEAFLAEVRRKSAVFKQKLGGLIAAHPDIFDSLRGEGLMLGLKCKCANTDMVAAGYEALVITVPAADNVIRLLPPLNITDDEIELAIERLDQAAQRLNPK